MSRIYIGEIMIDVGEDAFFTVTDAIDDVGLCRELHGWNPSLVLRKLSLMRIATPAEIVAKDLELAEKKQAGKVKRIEGMKAKLAKLYAEQEKK